MAFKLGRHKAIADHTRVIELDPTDAWAYYDRGETHEMKGDKEKSDADFARAKELGLED